MTDMPEQPPKQEPWDPTAHELHGTWEVVSSSNGEVVVKGLSEADAQAAASSLQAAYDAHLAERGDLAESYTLQGMTMRHDPPLKRAEARTYEAREWSHEQI